MPAPTNPYRQRGGDLPYTLLGEPQMHEGRIGRPHEEAPGFSAIDIEAAAQRNYTLGCQHGFRDREQEVGDLRRRLGHDLPQAYDEGYDAAEDRALGVFVSLLGPVEQLAADVSSGRAPNGKMLTPKQREAKAHELAGRVLALADVLGHEVVTEAAEPHAKSGWADRLEAQLVEAGRARGA